MPIARTCGAVIPLAACTSDLYPAAALESSSSCTVAMAPIRSPPPFFETPRSARTLRRLTTREGVSILSFMRLSRSVPPASTAVTPASGLKAWTAERASVGAMYSKFCMIDGLP